MTDFCILVLSSYDVIVSMDWLALHSPMGVHWLHKWMVISYHNSSVLLHGIYATLQPGSVIEVSMVDAVTPSFKDFGLPEQLLSLLAEFVEVFEAPTSIPPLRACDHAIPLVPGAAPVHVRPYRYPPAIKNGIERQILVMLQAGLTQPSNRPISSSMLLVKKDNPWLVCVDFYHLNAIIVKLVFPIPVIKELLDELSQAS